MKNSASDNTATRMNWLDGARLAAAFCIIGIHTSSDRLGGAFGDAESHDRVFPVLLRSVSELASTEFFILVSLFLLSLKLTKSSMGFIPTMQLQARRLLVPFAFWTLFYAFFRLYKANALGYEQAILEQLGSFSNWVGYFVLGNSNFHMHFLPTLFLLLLFHRLYKLAIDYPLLGLIVVPMLYLNQSIGGWIWGTIDDPVLRDYTVRFVKIITYSGYGFFAYSLYGFWQRGIDEKRAKALFGMSVFLVAVGFLIKLIYAQKVGVAEEFIVRRDMIFYGHYLLPCAVLLAFMCSWFLRWPDKLSQWSRFSFGMYLIHPAIMDVIDVAFAGIVVHPDWYVLMKYCATAFLSLSLTIVIGKIKLIAWTVGLGPLPWADRPALAAATTAMKTEDKETEDKETEGKETKGKQRFWPLLGQGRGRAFSESMGKRRGHSLYVSLAGVVAGMGVAGIIVYGMNMHTHSHKVQNITDPVGGGYDLGLPPENPRMSPVALDDGKMWSVKGGNTLESLIKPQNNSCLIGKGELSQDDLRMARIAWTYFENNYNPETGLVNAVNNYPSTTMWDTGSALAATVAAFDFGFIDKKDFDDRITALIGSLARMKLFNDEAPNKVYNTKTLAMVDYANKPTEFGIGVSALDLARLMSWSRTLSCMHPKYYTGIRKTISRWKFDRIIQDDQMYGLARDKSNPEEIKVWQEGRLGYEQYAGKIFTKYGFDAPVAASYENEYRGDVDILGVSIAHDSRDPETWHANNYVLTESYTMDAIELGLDGENTQLVRNIFEVQKQRWRDTGIVTAISEDNINQAPWFLYNTIYNAGKSWQTTNSSDVAYDHLKTISTKAAISMALLYPEDEYSAVLMNAVESAYDPEKGWYSGIYESGAGYNTVTTANTNGVILSGFLYKKYGSLFPHCQNCSRDIELDSDLLKKTSDYTQCEICEGE